MVLALRPVCGRRARHGSAAGDFVAGVRYRNGGGTALSIVQPSQIFDSVDGANVRFRTKGTFGRESWSRFGFSPVDIFLAHACGILWRCSDSPALFRI
ncbi:MAG TPA: hypothetical protein VFA22_06370 [Stellaceae bacterium]|nr:hypothetical protein [Stellaceae bacterium]